MSIKRIAFAGKKCSGKSTFLEYCFEAINGEAELVSTSETLIYLLAARLGMDPVGIKAAKERYRSQLQTLGDELEREQLAGVMRLALIGTETDKPVLVDSVRRNSEIWYLSRNNDTLFVLVEASEEDRQGRGTDTNDSHATETEAVQTLKLRALAGDPNVVVIENHDSLEDLRDQAHCFMKRYFSS